MYRCVPESLIDNQAEKPMIFVLGLLTHRAFNKDLFDLIKTRNIYVMELRNHYLDKENGREHATMTYEDQANDVIEFADSNNLKTFTLMGYAMGGRVAMATAGKYPERVENLIVLEADLGKMSYPDCDNGMRALLNISEKNMTVKEFLAEVETYKEKEPISYAVLNAVTVKSDNMEEKLQWKIN